MKRREAIRLGLDKYHTGKPCKNGHYSDRVTDSGNCIECESKRRVKHSTDSIGVDVDIVRPIVGVLCDVDAHGYVRAINNIQAESDFIVDYRRGGRKTFFTCNDDYVVNTIKSVIASIEYFIITCSNNGFKPVMTITGTIDNDVGGDFYVNDSIINAVDSVWYDDKSNYCFDIKFNHSKLTPFTRWALDAFCGNITDINIDESSRTGAPAPYGWGCIQVLVTKTLSSDAR